MVSSALNQHASNGMLGHITAYCVFDGKEVCETFDSNVFESILERETPLSGRQGNVFVAYVVANQNQLIQSIVLFKLPLDEQGFCLEGWRIPLQRLINTAGRGPNLGGGRIRLACHSQCSISWHQESLWDPGARHFSQIKSAIANYLAEFDGQVDALDLSSLSDDPTGMDQTDNTDLLRRELRNESAAYRNELQVLQQEVERQRLLNERLIKQLNNTPQATSGGKPEDKVDLQVLRRHNEQLSMKLRELEVSNENLRTQLSGTQSHVPVIDAEAEIETFLEDMSQQDIMSVVYQHGIGHINLTPDQVYDYLQDPIGYAANHASISKLNYKRWLDHEKKPKCHVCDDEIPVVSDPSTFDFEIDVYCHKHKP